MDSGDALESADTLGLLADVHEPAPHESFYLSLNADAGEAPCVFVRQRPHATADREPAAADG